MSCPQNARSDVEHDQRSTALISQQSSRIQPLLGANINNTLQFRNDSGNLSNRSGQGRGLCVIHNQRAPKSQRVYEQGQLISVRSGVNARVVAATHQPSRSAYRRESRPGRGLSSTHTPLNRTSPSSTGHRQDHNMCPVAISVHISRAASFASYDCASSPRRAERPKTPYIGTTPGRNDSRCAGIKR